MSKKTGRATISDIALASGVSKTTVSRYINGRRDLMSDKTGERIRAVIEMFNYQPSDIARSLKMKKTNLIGVLVADMTSPFSTAIMVSIGDTLAKHGYTPLFADSADSLEKEIETVNMFRSKDVAGLLVNTTSSANNHLISVACQGMPVVLCDRYIENYKFNIVTIENMRSVHSLVEHLKEQGFSRPVLFTERWENNSSRSLRREYFIQSVRELYGYDPSGDVFLIAEGPGCSPREQIERLWESLSPGEIPAVIGVNSVTTILAYKAIRSLGLRIPQDIGLCGPEDWNWRAEMNWPLLVDPPITTFSLPAKEMGRQAALLLLKLIDNPSRPPEEIQLACEMRIRLSTLLKKD